MLTLTDVLAHHGIVATERDIARLMAQGLNYGTAYDYALTDAAREAGLVRACLGCGTVAGVAPDASEQDRERTSSVLVWDCCDDADAVVF